MSNTNEPAAQVRYLRRGEAADYVAKTLGAPCTKNTLAKLATVGGGPAFRKIGPTPLYDPVDLKSWVEARLTKRVHSTSELGGAA